ncbi:hypothetical protein KC320_g226 [Hortaea werneckii]|nr:hypothetical protein KC320_g226 [Hortaea werneckii]
MREDRLPPITKSCTSNMTLSCHTCPGEPSRGCIKVNQLLRGENKDAVIAGNPEVLESQSRHYYVHGLHDNIVNQCSEFSTNPFVEALD